MVRVAVQSVLDEHPAGRAGVERALEVFEAGVVGLLAEAKGVPMASLWRPRGQGRVHA